MTTQSLRLISNDGHDFYELRGDNAIKVTADGHVSHLAAPGIVEERYRVFCNGSRSVIMADKKRLEDIGRLAALWHGEPERQQSYWLEETAKDEGGARRALVYGMSLRMTNEGHNNRVLNQAQVYGELVIQRAAEWESPAYEVITATLDVRDLGLLEITGKGTLPGRIARIKVEDQTTQINHLWMGIREKGLGFSSFNPFVECEDLTMGVDTASDVYVPASGGDVASCDFATTEEMSVRLEVKLSDFTASNHKHMFGEYVVLLGYLMQDSLSVIRMQITGDSVVSTTPVLADVTGANVIVAELGRIRVPARSLRGNLTDSDLVDIGFYVEAEILDYSGSPGKLSMDYIFLLPARHMLKLPGISMSSDRELYFYTHEDGEQTAVRTDTSGDDLDSFLDHEAVDFALPPGECLLALHGAQNIGVQAAQTVDVEIHYYPRYESYRGVDE